MTIIRTSLFAALGLLVAGSASSVQAGPIVAHTPTVALSDTVGLQQVTDRGSWVKPRTRWKHDYEYGYDRRYDDRHHRKHFKKKKRRKFYKRGFRRGFNRGYDEGYYDGRRRSYYDYRRRHYYDGGPRFRGGIYFGDGYFRGPGFRFRY